MYESHLQCCIVILIVAVVHPISIVLPLKTCTHIVFVTSLNIENEKKHIDFIWFIFFIGMPQQVNGQNSLKGSNIKSDPSVKTINAITPTTSPNSNQAAFNAQQQYASFEELQKLAENPFENNTSINVTVPLGDSAFLRCKVRNLGERSVSLIFYFPFFFPFAFPSF